MKQITVVVGNSIALDSLIAIVQKHKGNIATAEIFVESFNDGDSYGNTHVVTEVYLKFMAEDT